MLFSWFLVHRGKILEAILEQSMYLPRSHAGNKFPLWTIVIWRIMCMYWNFTVHLVTVHFGSPHWLQAGGNSICLCLTGVLLWPPPQKANLDSLRTLSWIISYWRLALIFQHSLSAVTRGIYLGGSPSTIYHYFSSLTCLYVLRSLGTDLSGINKAFSQVILLKGNVSEDDIFLKVFKFKLLLFVHGLKV